MEKEFVAYEQALELKELGFDEPCFGFHSKIHGLMMVKTSGSSSLYKDAGECLAPTYSQVFRFFREKYGYCSYIKEAIVDDYRFYIEKFDEKYYNSSIFKSYEEAELECLIKLIDIQTNER